MQIIFGEAAAEQVKDRVTLLELDTFKYSTSKDPITCYCVIGAGDMTLNKMSDLENMIKLHAALIENYKKKNWDFCVQALGHLIPYWGDDMKSYYDILQIRLREFIQNAPGSDWTYIEEK